MRRTTKILSRARTVSKSGAVYCLSILAAGLPLQAVHAGEFGYGIGYIGEFSDNIRRVSVLPEKEKISSVLAGVAYRENGPALDAYLLAQGQYNHYRNEIYPDSPVYFADATITWRILPQQLSWFFSDRYDQITANAGNPNTPDNQINTNAFYTGPDYFVRLGHVNTLVLGLRYGKTTYSEVVSTGRPDLDNDRTGAVVRWLYASDKELTYSLSYETEKQKYDDDAQGRTTRHDVYVRANKRLVHARFDLDLGATRLERYPPGTEVPASAGHLARLSWTQQLASGTSAGVRLASEYLDAGTALLSTATSPTPPGGGSPTPPASGNFTIDYFYSKRADVYYSRGDGNFGLNAAVYYRDIDYEVQPLDRKESGGRLDLTYNPSGVLSTTVYATYLSARYLNALPPRDDQNNGAGLSFTYRLNPKLSATLDGRRSWRNSTIESLDYTDRRLVFSLVYASNSLFAFTGR